MARGRVFQLSNVAEHTWQLWFKTTFTLLGSEMLVELGVDSSAVVHLVSAGVASGLGAGSISNLAHFYVWQFCVLSSSALWIMDPVPPNETANVFRLLHWVLWLALFHLERKTKHACGWHPCRKRRKDRGQRAEGHVRRQRRELCIHKPRIARNHQEWEETQKDSPLDPGVRAWPFDTLISDFWLLEPRIRLCCFKQPVCGDLLWQPTETNMKELESGIKNVGVCLLDAR